MHACTLQYAAGLPANLPCRHEAACATEHLHRSRLEHAAMGVAWAPRVPCRAHLQCIQREQRRTVCSEEFKSNKAGSQQLPTLEAPAPARSLLTFGYSGDCLALLLDSDEYQLAGSDAGPA